MAHLRVYKNAEGEGYLLDVQADLLNHLTTRVVVPLLPLDRAPTPAKTLNPVFHIDGTACAMVTQFMAAVPTTILKSVVLSLESQRLEVTTALDLLFHGF